MEEHQFRQCEWDECRFRFPAPVDEPRVGRCPRCGSQTHAVGVPESGQEKQAVNYRRPVFEALLDNIRSIHNVGSMFRTADGVGLAHLYLCGMTATPAHAKLSKAALGAQEKVPWSYSPNGLDTAVSLKEKGCQLWSMEATVNAEPFFAADRERPNARFIVVVGNENAGVDPGILEISDRVFSLPMYGYKRSLNVAVAFGIVMYHLCYAWQLSPRNH